MNLQIFGHLLDLFVVYGTLHAGLVCLFSVGFCVLLFSWMHSADISRHSCIITAGKSLSTS